jgi:tRNA (guanine37-N1)-methyltransferase
LQDGALNDAESAAQDSFEDGLLDCPHYTRPVEHALGGVPEVLLSGDHARIAAWRRMQSLGRTAERRPDLLEGRALSKKDTELLRQYMVERAETPAAPEPRSGADPESGGP